MDVARPVLSRLLRELLVGVDHAVLGTLRNDNHAVALLFDALVDLGDETILAAELEGLLGHEAKVDLTGGHRCIQRDVAGVATHELDEADAVDHSGRLDIRGMDDLGGLCDAGLEAKRLVDDRDIVVDALRDAGEGDVLAAPLGEVGQGLDTAVSAIAADDVDLVDPTSLDLVKDFVTVLLTAEATAR